MLTDLGWLVLDQSDFTRANMLLEEGLMLYRELGDKRGIAGALTDLGGLRRCNNRISPPRSFSKKVLRFIANGR